MPDGKIVAWDQANGRDFGPVPHNGPAMVLDPASGAVTRSTNIAPRTTFCSLITSLPDGRLAVIGGGTDSGGGATSKVQVYDEDSKTFSVLGQMERRAGIRAARIDRQGNPIVAGGTSTGIERIDALDRDRHHAQHLLPGELVCRPDPDPGRPLRDRGRRRQRGENPGRFMLNGTSLSRSPTRTLLKTRRRGIRTMIGPHKMFYSSGGTSRDSMIIDASGGTPTYSAAASRFPHMTGRRSPFPRATCWPSAETARAATSAPPS